MLAYTNFSDFGMLYIESAATTCIVYGRFMDRELQNEREKSDISRLKGLYRNLQVGNLGKLVKNR